MILLKLGLATASGYMAYKLAYQEQEKIKSKFYHLMHQINLRNKAFQIFKVHKVNKAAYGYKVIIKNPTGYSAADLEKYQDKIISTFNCPVELEDNKAYTLLNLIYSPLKNLEFIPKKCQGNELILGYDYRNHIKIDMNVLPHMLIGGINGSGKTRFLYTILLNLIYNQNANLNFAQILKSDIEVFSKSKQVKRKSRTVEQSLKLFQELNSEMERRIRIFDRLIDKKILNIESYNKYFKNKQMPYEYLVIEEFSDFMPSDIDSKEVKKQKEQCLSLLERLIKASRSTGIFLVICLQATTCDQMPVFLRKQCNIRVSFRQAEESASINVIGSKEAVGLKRGEFVMVADKKYLCQCPNITFKHIDEYIGDTIDNNIKDKTIVETTNKVQATVENIVVREMTKEEAAAIKNKNNPINPIPKKKVDKVVEMDGLRRVL